jgi:hypothetical protein
MTRRLGHDRYDVASRFLTWLAFAISLMALVGAPILALAWNNRAFPGFMVEPTLVVTDRSGAGWQGIEAGISYPAHVERFGGQEVRSTWHLQSLMRDAQVGESHSFFLRYPDGSARLVPGVQLQPFPAADLLRLFLLPYMIGVVYLAIGVWIYGVRGATRPGRALAFFCASTAVACMLLFDLSTTHVAAAAWTTAVALIGGALISLAMRFPEDWSLIDRQRWLLAIPYLVSIGLAVWGVALLYDVVRPWAYIDAWGASYRYAALGIVFLLTSMLVRAARSPGSVARSQARLMLLASVLAFVPITIWFLLPLFGRAAAFNAALLLPGLVIFPLAVAAAILRFRLLDVDFVVNRTLVYAVLTAVLAGLYSASIGLSQRLFVAFTGERSDAAIVITTLIVASTFTPLKSWLQAVAERRVSTGPPPSVNLERFAEDIQRQLDLADPVRLARRLLEEAQRDLGAGSGIVVLDAQGTMRLAHAVGRWRGDVRLSVPLTVDGRRLGAVLLGPRADGQLYSPADLAVLEKAALYTGQAMAMGAAVPSAPRAGKRPAPRAT